MTNGDRWLAALGILVLAFLLSYAVQCQASSNAARAAMVRDGCKCVEMGGGEK